MWEGRKIWKIWHLFKKLLSSVGNVKTRWEVFSKFSCLLIISELYKVGQYCNKSTRSEKQSWNWVIANWAISKLQMNYHFLGPLCSSRVEYARPRRLLNAEMQWRVIVNDGQKLQQTVRLETCLKVKIIMVTIKSYLN